MSRLLIISFAFSATTATAQSDPDNDVAAQIEKARRLVAVDKDGCVKYPQTNEIVVCGEDPDTVSQRIFQGSEDEGESRIRRGEAVSTRRAAACISGDSMCKIYLKKSIGVGFGYVPPPAIPLEEVLRGLPEPDMVVLENKQPE